MSTHDPRSTTARLRGRDDELAALGGRLDALSGGAGGAVLVVGPPGSGRSALLDRALERVPSTARVVRIHAGPEEAHWPLAAVTDLVHRLRESRSRLPASLRAVLDDVMGDRGEADEASGPVVAALTALVTEAACSVPLVIAIDDADRLDPDSAVVLASMSRRLTDEPALVVLTAAPAGAETFRFLPVIGLGPLAPLESESVVTDTAGVPVAPSVRDEIVEVADGSPAALVELTRALTDDELAGRSPLSEPLPVGPLLEKAALAGLATWDPGTIAGLEVLAVAGELESTVLERAVAGLRPPPPPGWRDRAERAGLLGSDAGRVVLNDRIVRAALVHQLDAPTRRALHALLAEALGPGDPRSLWHRASACADHDDDLADALVDSAVGARRRGALVAAGSSLARAAELSSDPTEQAERALAAARAHHEAGHPGPVPRLLSLADQARRRVVSGPATPVLEAEALRIEGLLLFDRGALDAALGRVRRAAELLGSERPDQEASVLLDAVPPTLRSGRADLAAALVRDATTALAQAGPSTGYAEHIALEHQRCDLAAAAVSVARGGPDALARLLDAVRAVERSGPGSAPFVAECAGLALVWSERYDDAATLLTGLERRARADAAPAPLATVRAVQGLAAMRRGRLRDAATASAEAVALCEDAARADLAPFAHAVLAVTEAQRGEASGCRASAEWLLAAVARGNDERWEVPGRAALGLLALGTGRPDDAVREMAPLRERPPASPWLVMWEGDLAEALIRADRRPEARALVADLERQAGWQSGRAGAVLLRVRALLEDDPDEAVEGLRRAAELSAAAGVRLGWARSRLWEGQILRRTRRRVEAQRALQDAHLTFAAMGADLWTRTAAAELRASGAPGPSGPPDALTPQELQVARLVADGASNKAVAEALFISVRTVESHLGRTFRKLGVRSRSELAAQRSVLHEP